MVYTFHAIKPAYKDHLCIRSTFCWSLGWSLYTNFTVVDYVLRRLWNGAVELPELVLILEQAITDLSVLVDQSVVLILVWS